MGGFELKWFVRVAVVLMMVPEILGWGKEGHYVICKIAQEYLTEDALAAVKALLPDQAEGDLSNVCFWADEVRHHYHYRWSAPLHYVDTPDFLCNYKYCLTDNLTEALMFLSHFVGDVHQPLHVGFIGDLGGNTIVVRWYRRKTNLHHVWDTMIIESALKTYYKSDIMLMIQALMKNITDGWSDEVPSWEDCPKLVCPDPYASESIHLACKFAYRNATPGSTLTDDYFLSRRPVVEKRLAQSGVRLAEVLNRIFTKKPSVVAQ
ncbi:Endonuclease 5 [Capsicum annuum]|nr:Endonuclease 5 [Capsicum annuum]